MFKHNELEDEKTRIWKIKINY